MLMKQVLIGLAVLLILLVGEVRAEAPAAKPPAAAPSTSPEKAPAAPATRKPGGSGGVATKEPNTEELSKAAEIQEMYKAGRYDQAVEAGNKFLATAKDDLARTQASQAVAESLRKKGDWLHAPAAYQRLRGCCEKGSSDWARYDAIVEILQRSKGGVYLAPDTPTPVPGSPEAARVLSDDAVLAEALARWAGFRLKGFKSHLPFLRHATTPKDVLAVVKPLSEDAERIFSLAKDVPPEASREIGAAAASRLKEVADQIVPALKAKFLTYKSKMDAPWAFTNVEKQDIQNVNALCKQMAESEKDFQGCLSGLAGPGNWTDAERFKTDSAKRQADYEQLTDQFVVPPYTVRIIR
jgi:hypothetical protein